MRSHNIKTQFLLLSFFTATVQARENLLDRVVPKTDLFVVVCPARIPLCTSPKQPFPSGSLSKTLSSSRGISHSSDKIGTNTGDGLLLAAIIGSKAGISLSCKEIYIYIYIHLTVHGLHVALSHCQAI